MNLGQGSCDLSRAQILVARFASCFWRGIKVQRWKKRWFGVVQFQIFNFFLSLYALYSMISYDDFLIKSDLQYHLWSCFQDLIYHFLLGCTVTNDSLTFLDFLGLTRIHLLVIFLRLHPVISHGIPWEIPFYSPLHLQKLVGNSISSRLFRLVQRELFGARAIQLLPSGNLT